MIRFKIDGFVIRGFSMGETSRIVTIYSRQKGKLKCVGKGAQKSATLKGIGLELFSHVECYIHRKENVELGTISSIDLLNDYSTLAADPLKFGYGSAFCEIIDKFTTNDEPITELFELSGEFFDEIEQCRTEMAAAIFWAAFLKALGHLGYRPQLYSCAICGKSNKGRAAYYDVARGGIICSKDALPEVQHGKLTAAGLRSLQQCLELPLPQIANLNPSAKILGEIEQFVISFAKYHTGLHRDLKSFKFLSQLKRR